MVKNSHDLVDPTSVINGPRCEVVPRLLRHGCTVIKDQVGLKEFNNFHSRRSIFILRGDESAQRAPKDEN